MSEPIITVHVSKDVSPETLKALADMMRCLLDAMEREEDPDDIAHEDEMIERRRSGEYFE